MIDTHAHIYATEFDHDRDEVVQRAKAQGIEAILLPNIDLASIEPMLKTEAAYPELCRSMMGLHPCYVDGNVKQTLTVIESWLDKHPFIAIGEIGIDLYWDKTFQAEQEMAFVTQLSWAKERDLPVVIHTRDSITQTLQLLEKEQDGSLSGVFHCFGGTLEEAKAINELGFHLGIGGVSTFKNGGMDKVLPHLDMNFVLLETDCPYLAPAPHRGKRNEPAYTTLVAKRIAELTELSLVEVNNITNTNANSLFKL
ncbi:TatD family hydrolase [Vibrio anguillarum]|uniref:TatD family deoxyribonuclease n=1 Tax=Vibrio anguillarum TaxID=55601 RepID=A0AAW4BFX4_VIBAN|nr:MULTISPECIES: TatD family hydrolase [Vibrio]MBF4435629.1 TatD family deoxyribonuclease [Vibrio anguillarum]MDQ2193994.1 TatD family deoxyribonuclease [Vibrio sp. A14(2019)]MDQ2198239.1 TatD family deoxyribonuclease [Vibrio sp. 2017_1457_11]NNN77443.1 TatD family deoxyribonuclease [Vibrio sp. B7]NNN94224.1 TatD family deoxyribonuclease [Vibrio sp. B8-1]